MSGRIRATARRPGAVLAALLAVASLARADAGLPDGVCVSSSGEVLLDRGTGLVWMRTHVVRDWKGAADYCAALQAGPYDQGWRLPTIKELATLVDGNQVPAQVSAAFPMLARQDEELPFWSATPVASQRDQAWAIPFKAISYQWSGATMQIPVGSIEAFALTATDNITPTRGYVRCVH